MSVFLISKCFIIITVFTIHWCHKPIYAKRLYQHQFDEDAEHLPLPPIILFSIYMGKIQYPHLPLLLESMRWNPQIQYTIINIVPDSSYTEDLEKLIKRLNVSNLKLVRLNIQEWTIRANGHLGTNIQFAEDWYYKLCDFKPTVAYLFPELVTDNFKWWGFADMDVIWGNVTRFSKW